jgi:hypothetical protein
VVVALWLRRFLGQRDLLNPLEERLLAELENALTPEGAALLAAQVGRINLVQRHSKGREVCCYALRNGRPHRDERLRFPANQPDLRFASIRFESGGHTFSADFYLVEGYFFSIEFSQSPPREVAQAKGEPAEGGRLIVKGVNVHHDPMQSPPPAVVGTATPILRGWLAEFPWANEISGLKSPLPAPERARHLAAIDAILPTDYTFACEVTDGFCFRTAVVSGLVDVYSIRLDDSSYWVFGQVEDVGVLAVRAESRDGVIYLLPHDGPQRLLGDSLGRALLMDLAGAE